jgi:hypothetical protein
MVRGRRRPPPPKGATLGQGRQWGKWHPGALALKGATSGQGRQWGKWHPGTLALKGATWGQGRHWGKWRCGALAPGISGPVSAGELYRLALIPLSNSPLPAGTATHGEKV